MSTATRNDPIPTRFKAEESAFLAEAAAATGIPVCELIRRGVRLMKRQREIVRSFSFITDLHEQR